MSYKVSVQGAVGWIDPPPPPEVAVVLNHSMTFFDPHEPLRFQYLYNVDAASFYPGFCSRVVTTLQEHGHEAELRVLLPPPTAGVVYAGMGPDDPLPLQQGVSLYDSQNAVLPELYRMRYGMLWGAIGFGKTHIAAATLAAFNRPGFVLCQRKEEIRQGRARLSELLPGVDVGEWSGGTKELGHITVATTAGLLSAYRLGRHPELREAWEGCRTVVLDEAHLGASDGHQFLLQQARGTTARIGLTATAEWEDGRDLLIEAQLGAVAHHTTLPELVAEGRAVPTHCVVVHLPKRKYWTHDQVLDQAQRVVKEQPGTTLPAAVDYVLANLPDGVTYAPEYEDLARDYVVRNPVRTREVVSWCVGMATTGRTTAVIVDRVEHGELLQQAIGQVLPEHVVCWLHGGSTEAERVAALDGLRDKTVPVVVTTLMDRAVDVPTLDSLVLATAGRSAVQLVQRMRMTRAAPGKVVSYLLMFFDNAPALRQQSLERLRVLRDLGTFTFEKRVAAV